MINLFKFLIISDLHGFFEEFMIMVNQTPKEVKIILLGDIPDYGPNSKEIIEFLIQHPEIIWIMGNHEHLMTKVYRQVNNGHKHMYYPHHWIYVNGGSKTLKSYGLDVKYPDVGVSSSKFRKYVSDLENSQQIKEFINLPEVQYSIELIKQIPLEHIEYMEKLPLFFETDEFICTHAPMNNWRNKNHVDLKRMESQEHILYNGCFWNRHYPRRPRKDNKFEIFGHMNLDEILSFTTKYPNGIYSIGALHPDSFAACFDLAKAGFIVGMEWPSKKLQFIEIKNKI